MPTSIHDVHKRRIALRPPEKYTSAQQNADGRAPNSRDSPPAPPPPSWLEGTWYVTHSSLPLWKDKRNVTEHYEVRYDPACSFHRGGGVASGGGDGNSEAEAGGDADQGRSRLRLDDTGTYQKLDSDKVHTLHGRDKPLGEEDQSKDGGSGSGSGSGRASAPAAGVGPAGYKWRGSSYLKPATSQWEILGHGELPAVPVPSISSPSSPSSPPEVARQSGGAGDGQAAAADDGAGGNQWVVTYYQKTLFTPAGLDIYSRDKKGLPAEMVGAILEALAGLTEDPEFKRLVGEIFEIKRD